MSDTISAIIPARIGSTRLPEKPLLRDTGKYLIQHVYERTSLAKRIDRVIVATDSQRIYDAVRSFHGEVELTSETHRSGTDRVAEVVRRLDLGGVINVQGDEPELDPGDLDRVAESILECETDIATLAVELNEECAWLDTHVVKVVVDGQGRARYFSRSPIPWSTDFKSLRAAGAAKKHLGVYGYSRGVLERFASLPQSPLERLERLEQLRALENGIPIRVLTACSDSIGIDTLEDYRRFTDQQARQARTPS